jgi:phage minor structural protein
VVIVKNTSNQKLFVLDRSEKCVAILDPTLPRGFPYFDDLHTEHIQYGFKTLEFSIPGNHPQAIHLVNDHLVIYPNDQEELELFQIKQVSEEHEASQYTKKLLCENAAVTDLLGTIIRPAKLPSYTLEQAISYILTGTGWELGKAEYHGAKDFDFHDYPTVLQAIHEILAAFEAEIQFTVEFNGTKIVKRKVEALLQRGRRTLKPFVYGQDLIGAQREEDGRERITALIGLGLGDNNGQLLTFANYTPPVTEGFEKVDDWVGSLEALARREGRKHLFGVYRDDKAQNAVELYCNTLEQLKKLSKPQLTYTVSVALLADLIGIEAHQVRIGDTVVVKDTTFQPELIVEARVLEKKTSKRNLIQNTIILGQFTPIVLNDLHLLQRLQSTLLQNQQKWNTASTTADNAKTTLDEWKYPTDTTKIDGGQIYTGSVTAKQIAAHTITSSHIDTAGLTADVIQSGKINTDHVTIGDPAGKVEITGGNVIIKGGNLEVYHTPEASDNGVMIRGNKIFTNFIKNPDFDHPPSEADWNLAIQTRYDATQKIIIIDTTSTMPYTGVNQWIDIYHPRATFQALFQTNLFGGSTPKNVRFYLYCYDSKGTRLADRSKQETFALFQSQHLLTWNVEFPPGTVRCLLFVQAEMKYNLKAGMEIHWIKASYDGWVSQEQLLAIPKDVYNVQAKAEMQMFHILISLSKTLTANIYYLVGEAEFDKPFTPISDEERVIVLLTPADGNSVFYSARPYAIDHKGFTLYLYCHKTFSTSSIQVQGLAYRTGYYGQLGFSL